MNFQPLPDPRQRVIEDLHSQIDRFFAADGQVAEPALGASKEGLPSVVETRAQKLRAGRDRLPPCVRDMAAKGASAQAIAQALSTSHTRVKLIARENDITIGGDQ
jgi:hypothetical protein